MKLSTWWQLLGFYEVIFVWPLVLVAPSTAQDPTGRLLIAAANGLSDLPIRLLITTNRRPPAGGLRALEAAGAGVAGRRPLPTRL